MLEGITVLSENTVSLLGHGVILIVLGALAILAGVLVIIAALNIHYYSLCCVSLVLFIVGLAIIAQGRIEYTKKPTIEYKVTIDDTVNFKEFNNRYTIIDQDGDIYTIIEKENK